jgi:predicted enzyme related to lactoylglutathione lyase
MNRPIHVEFRSADPGKSQAFYGELFGWKFEKLPSGGAPVEYWGIATGKETDPGVHGGMMKPRDNTPRTVAWVEVADVDKATAQVAKLGGKVLVPKMPVPGVGMLAYCADPEGVVFAVVKCETSHR